MIYLVKIQDRFWIVKAFVTLAKALTANAFAAFQLSNLFEFCYIVPLLFHIT